MTFGGVDTYYDYDEHQWKFRRLGGGPVRKHAVAASHSAPDNEPATEPAIGQRVSSSKPADSRKGTVGRRR
jgi:hypothetical protein